eukprot:8702947-Pyramimonas_sp.AAC.1
MPYELHRDPLGINRADPRLHARAATAASLSATGGPHWARIRGHSGKATLEEEEEEEEEEEQEEEEEEEQEE